MKLGFVPRSTAFCVVVISLAIMACVAAWCIQSVPESIGFSIIAALLALWGAMAWPHDTVYTLCINHHGEMKITTITLPSRWSNEYCWAYVSVRTTGIITSMEPMGEILHCPLARYREVGHY